MLRKFGRFHAWMLASLLCMGCRASSVPPENSPVQAATQENPEISVETQEIDVESMLSLHTNAWNALTNRENSGVSETWNSCLDQRSDVMRAWVRAVNSHSDGALMLLIMRMAESNESFVPDAIQRMEQLRDKPRKVSLDDIFDYHIGRLYAFQVGKLQGEEARTSLKRAFEAFSRVGEYRESPYYHLALAEKLKTGIALGADITQELRKFILSYPDYPGLKEFQLELSTREYESGMKEAAQARVQDLAFYYPWSPVSADASKWLEDRGIAPVERSFEEEFARVDSLRKARFWDDAQRAADEAMPKYPESYQLMVQNARIAYERSEHGEAARRFEAILEKLGGETKDKLRPAGVIAYIYRAYGYAGNCTKALEYLAMNTSKQGKKDAAKATMDYALTCGALDVAYQNAKIVYADASDADSLFWFGLIAYLNADYDTARLNFSAAKEDLTGTQKRRAEYFIAQATLKRALKGEQGSDGAAPESEPEKIVVDAKKTSKKSNSKNSKRSKKTKSEKKVVKLAPATVDRAIGMFKSLISSDGGDYYAILANSRLKELERGEGASSPKTPVMQTFEKVEMSEGLRRPWDEEFVYDEKEVLSHLHRDVERYKDAVPELERVEFLHDAELYLERNALFRALSIEIMGVTRMGKRPTAANLWSTKLSVDGHLVDNRRNKAGFWGHALDTYRFELPGKKETAKRNEIAERQGAIYDQGTGLKKFVLEMLPAFHDYYMARKYTSSPSGTCGGERSLRDCSTFYPHAFSHAVIDASTNNNISPELIWALMNIESAFNPDSISHADAYGLLQVIPMTGYKIADAMDNHTFGPYDLIRPESSIYMGAWYFAQILKKFHGYATLSMAAYNGGPHQVARWLTAYSGKMEQDAFIELIPLNEARNYVKKGMARLLIFHRIDRGDPKAYFEIPNTLPETFEVMPNY